MYLLITLQYMTYLLTQTADKALALAFLWAVLAAFDALPSGVNIDRNCDSGFYSWYNFSHLYVIALNMTIAVGSLNGILFYANIVAANANTYFFAIHDSWFCHCVHIMA